MADWRSTGESGSVPPPAVIGFAVVRGRALGQRMIGDAAIERTAIRDLLKGGGLSPDDLGRIRLIPRRTRERPGGQGL